MVVLNLRVELRNYGVIKWWVIKWKTKKGKGSNTISMKISKFSEIENFPPKLNRQDEGKERELISKSQSYSTFPYSLSFFPSSISLFSSSIFRFFFPFPFPLYFLIFFSSPLFQLLPRSRSVYNSSFFFFFSLLCWFCFNHLIHSLLDNIFCRFKNGRERWERAFGCQDSCSEQR